MSWRKELMDRFTAYDDRRVDRACVLMGLHAVSYSGLGDEFDRSVARATIVRALAGRGWSHSLDATIFHAAKQNQEKQQTAGK